LCALLAPLPARAVQPDEMLQNPALETRARDISRHLRCLVCQNQSIDDSDADLARDLRIVVRDRLKAGDSDAQVTAYITARYGDFVLLKPPFKPATWILWFGPAAILLVGMAGIAVYLRRRPASAAAPGLSDAERKRLADLLKDR
jgi:cytochrome c-type biogenesis protein CcmH